MRCGLIYVIDHCGEDTSLVTAGRGAHTHYSRAGRQVTRSDSGATASTLGKSSFGCQEDERPACRYSSLVTARNKTTHGEEKGSLHQTLLGRHWCVCEDVMQCCSSCVRGSVGSMVCGVVALTSSGWLLFRRDKAGTQGQCRATSLHPALFVPCVVYWQAWRRLLLCLKLLKRLKSTSPVEPDRLRG